MFNNLEQEVLYNHVKSNLHDSSLIELEFNYSDKKIRLVFDVYDEKLKDYIAIKFIFLQVRKMEFSEGMFNIEDNAPEVNAFNIIDSKNIEMVLLDSDTLYSSRILFLFENFIIERVLS